jgi:hypothetical protein
MEFEINNSDIQVSFDRIAKELLLKHVISVNDLDFEITEIEFYFFNVEHHPDNYTHPHNMQAGSWRLHKQGIDITFDGTKEKEDGGILIRGLKSGDRYVNGPIKSLAWILESMGNVQNKNHIILKSKELVNSEIIKTFRHLPNKIQQKEFHLKKYRYLKELEKIDLTQKIKNEIKDYYEKV